MFSHKQLSTAEHILQRCKALEIKLAVAESCTGGLIASCLTAIPGSSQVFDRGFVTYSDIAKIQMLGVPEPLLRTYGAVSEEVSRCMAEGALNRSLAQASVAVTGIAGPGGATEGKPVGLVHIASAQIGRSVAHARHVFRGSRQEVRDSTVEAALSLLAEMLNAASSLKVSVNGSGF